MKKKNLERILNFIREEMMTTGSTPGKPGFSSAAPAKGPTAGFDPVIGKVKKRKPTPLGRYRTRVNWRQKDES
tara:strand:- start:53 stop:271 length:219 start_codon:yes stop_codon:yes gene_type:complete